MALNSNTVSSASSVIAPFLILFPLSAFLLSLRNSFMFCYKSSLIWGESWRVEVSWKPATFLCCDTHISTFLSETDTQTGKRKGIIIPGKQAREGNLDIYMSVSQTLPTDRVYSSHTSIWRKEANESRYSTRLHKPLSSCSFLPTSAFRCPDAPVTPSFPPKRTNNTQRETFRWMLVMLIERRLISGSWRGSAVSSPDVSSPAPPWSCPALLWGLVQPESCSPPTAAADPPAQHAACDTNTNQCFGDGQKHQHSSHMPKNCWLIKDVLYGKGSCKDPLK